MPSLLRGRVPRRLGIVLLALSAACGGDDEGPGAPAAVEVVAGSNQQGTVGQPVPTTPSVKVRDAKGHGLVGITVKFTVTGGGGTLVGDSTKTDAQGVAVLGQWTLGTTAGANTLRAQASGLTTAATLTATARPDVPATLTPIGWQNFAALVGQQVNPKPTLEAKDQYGNLVPNAAITFAVTQGGGTVAGGAATTDASGRATVGSWTLGNAAGTNRMQASSTNGATATFNAQGTAVAPTIEAASPTTQSGFLGAMVPRVPRVLVKDQLGQPMANIPVQFAITAGDGTLAGAMAVSGNDGVAAPQDWKLGNAVGGGTVEATMPGYAGPKVAFSSTGTFTGFVIDVRLLTTMTPAQRDAFASAANRWMQIIVGDIADVPANIGAGQACFNNPLTPAINETIDDVIIYAQVTTIDGAGGILGSAGPCIRRTSSFFTAIGSMRFDVADLNNLQSTNRLEPVILHEMAHVLGFGTVWEDKHVITGVGGADPIFTGAEALAVWPTFNLGYAGTPIPVENSGGSGTRDSHWRESVFVSELMTGFIEPPGVPTPLSKLTIASFKDLGYTVSYTTADAYAGNLMAALRERSGAAPTPLNDRLDAPKWEISPLGVLRPIP